MRISVSHDDDSLSETYLCGKLSLCSHILLLLETLQDMKSLLMNECKGPEWISPGRLPIFPS